MELPRWGSGKEPACQCKRCGFDSCIPWRTKWQPFLPGKSHEQRSLVGYSLWGHKESVTTNHTCPHIPYIGEGSMCPRNGIFCCYWVKCSTDVYLVQFIRVVQVFYFLDLLSRQSIIFSNAACKASVIIIESIFPHINSKTYCFINLGALLLSMQCL